MKVNGGAVHQQGSTCAVRDQVQELHFMQVFSLLWARQGAGRCSHSLCDTKLTRGCTSGYVNRNFTHPGASAVCSAEYLHSGFEIAHQWCQAQFYIPLFCIWRLCPPLRVQSEALQLTCELLSTCSFLVCAAAWWVVVPGRSDRSKWDYPLARASSAKTLQRALRWEAKQLHLCSLNLVTNRILTELVAPPGWVDESVCDRQVLHRFIIIT